MASYVYSSGKMAASVVALLPLYWTVAQMSDVLTCDGRKLLMNPAVMGVLAYGTAFAATGDGVATTRGLVIAALLSYYLFLYRPDIGKKYFRKQVFNRKDECSTEDAPPS